MKSMLPILLFLVLSTAACRTVGVEIADDALEHSIGLTEDDLLEAYGVPHTSSTDSDGVRRIGYGVEHWTLFSLDATTTVEFTLVDGRVVKTRRAFARSIANKNRAR